jgi:hypothetical protein
MIPKSFFKTLKKHVLIIQIIKNHHHFNQEICENLILKIIYQIHYFINVMVIQSSVFIMILKWNNPFMYPNSEHTLLSHIFQVHFRYVWFIDSNS